MAVVLWSGVGTSLSPLVPTGYDVVWWLAAAGLVLATVAALGRVLRSRQLTTKARLVWFLLVPLTFPLGGIAALLLVPSSRAPRQKNTA